MLGTDSLEYDILERAVARIGHLPAEAMSCEIGLREGGGSKYMLDTLFNTNQHSRTHIAIDPYGNIEYETAENQTTRHDYTNQMRNKCMRELYFYASMHLYNAINVLVFILEDTEFFNRYGDGVPVYAEYKSLLTKYAVVHFDGPHAAIPLKQEFDFFFERSLDGSVFVFDDIGNYDHDLFEKDVLFPNKLELLEKGTRKASYLVKK